MLKKVHRHLPNLFKTHKGPASRKASRTGIASRSSTALAYDSLEQRHLLAVAFVSDSTLFLNGTNVSEILSVRNVGQDLVVFSNTPTFTGTLDSFPAAGITAIQIIGAGGDDQLVNRTDLPSTIYGGTGNDVLVGGTRADVLAGQSGDDQLHGDFGGAGQTAGGNDQITGGPGNDIARGNGGDDLLSGNNGLDSLFGEEGDDLLIGGNDNDSLFGQGGNDRLFGSSGTDILSGSHGNDILRGQDGNDRLISSNLIGSNDLGGGTGDDTYVFSGSGAIAAIDTVREFANQGNDQAILNDVDVSYTTSLTSSRLAEFGNRTVNAVAPGNIEFVTETFDDVPELRVVNAEFTGGTGTVFHGVFSVVASDVDGVSLSSSGFLDDVSVRFFVGRGGNNLPFFTNSSADLTPDSKQQLANGDVVFHYSLDIDTRFHSSTVVDATFDSVRVEVPAGSFVDSIGRDNVAQLTGDTFPSPTYHLEALTGPSLAITNAVFTETGPTSTYRGEFSVTGAAADGIQLASRGLLSDVKVRVVFDGRLPASNPLGINSHRVANFTDLLPVEKRSLPNGDIAFDYEFEIGVTFVSPLVAEVDAVTIDVSGGEFVGVDGNQNLPQVFGESFPLPPVPTSGSTPELSLGDASFFNEADGLQSEFIGTFTVIAQDGNGIRNNSRGQLNEVSVRYAEDGGNTSAIPGPTNFKSRTFTNLLPIQKRILDNGDVAFDYSIRIANPFFSPISLSVDAIFVDVLEGEFLDSNGNANISSYFAETFVNSKARNVS